MDLSNYNPRDEVSRQTGWGFMGYLEDDTPIPIGAYSTYRDGVAHANSWLNSVPRAARWEAEALYEPMGPDDA
jgi:hypothetical protein